MYQGRGLVLKYYRSKSSRAMYLNEKDSLTSMASCKISNVPTVLEYGDKETFILMTYVGVDGIDLINEGKMNNRIWTNFVTQIYPIINEMHVCGFVHRDLKPENVTFLNGTWSIVDFGFMESDTIPIVKHVFGTYPYCSPFLGNQWCMDMFLKYHPLTFMKKANDYFGFAMTVLSLRNLVNDFRSDHSVTVDLLQVHKIVVSSNDRVLVSCAKLILAFTEINFQHMTWFKGGRCVFSKPFTKEARIVFNVSRNIEECWADVGTSIIEKRKILRNKTNVQFEHKHEESD